jgi:hypothetical protein
MLGTLLTVCMLVVLAPFIIMFAGHFLGLVLTMIGQLFEAIAKAFLWLARAVTNLIKRVTT